MQRAEAPFATPATRAAAKSLGAAIRQARIARNMSLTDCAQRARTSAATLGRIESGDVAVRIGSWLSVLEICNLLHLLDAASDPDADPLGRSERQRHARQRPRRAPAAEGTPGDYDF